MRRPSWRTLRSGAAGIREAPSPEGLGEDQAGGSGQAQGSARGVQRWAAGVGGYTVRAAVGDWLERGLARFGGLLAVAILPALAGITGQAYLHPDVLAAGFRIAVLISGGLCAAGGPLAAVTITNRQATCRSGRTKTQPVVSTSRSEPTRHRGRSRRPATRHLR